MSPAKKRVRSTTMRADSWKVLHEAIETACRRLPRRFDKAGMGILARELDSPEAQSIIEDVVIGEICEWFQFDEEGE